MILFMLCSLDFEKERSFYLWEQINLERQGMCCVLSPEEKACICHCFWKETV